MHGKVFQMVLKWKLGKKNGEKQVGEGWICSLPPDPSCYVEAGRFMIDIKVDHYTVFVSHML